MEVEEFPGRPITEEELQNIKSKNEDIEFHKVFHSECEQCEEEGITAMLVREDRTVYSVEHIKGGWITRVLEDNIEPETFRELVEQMDSEMMKS